MNNKESFSTTSVGSATSSTAAPDILDANIISEIDRRISKHNSENITDSIKNLGIIAREIQKDGNYTFPADLNVTGNINLPQNNNNTI